MAKKKKIPEVQEKDALPKKRKNKLVEQGLALFDQLVSYFELLYLYLQKNIEEKVRKAFIVTIALAYVLFLKIIGTVLLIASGYFFVLEYTGGNHIITSLSIGAGLILFSLGLLVFLLKKLI